MAALPGAHCGSARRPARIKGSARYGKLVHRLPLAARRGILARLSPLRADPKPPMLISPPPVPLDRRQSPTALAVARGTQRMLLALGLSCVAELPLLSGRRAD